ncbi:hypothetical protein OKE80_10405 [Riemerella anatipestifer]|uniref:hypothetical protein n=1 Tax=Riemerella anatipestifer TaxID=34085 RepID=UPI0020980578|nr:hypothetical protein [Riemerella anatipestifer]MCO7319719.1 hypothetical protein [Riemerella anatipestifer]MCQ4181982.1 hypothetical protein [Riemerella anatipestifer]MCW0475218.1 hypothetical protein [Riemerella anatipestifer]
MNLIMTIHHIVNLVAQHKDQHLIFFRQGSFRKCYNYHAMHFTQHIKPMKVHTRFYKNANTYVHSMGFPETALPRYIEHCQNYHKAQVAEETQDYILLATSPWHTTTPYEVWNTLKIQKHNQLEALQYQQHLLTQEIEPQHLPYEKIAKMVQQFRIEAATPLDAFNLVQKLKKLLPNE